MLIDEDLRLSSYIWWSLSSLNKNGGLFSLHTQSITPQMMAFRCLHTGVQAWLICVSSSPSELRNPLKKEPRTSRSPRLTHFVCITLESSTRASLDYEPKAS